MRKTFVHNRLTAVSFFDIISIGFYYTFQRKDNSMNKFNSSEYIRSRKAYVVQSTSEYFVSLLVTDVFLAKLLSSIGISDSLVGIISSFVTLAFVFQVLTLFMTKIKVNSKKTVMLFDTISIFCFMFMYLIPFLPVGKTQKTVLLILSILMAYFCKYLIVNICFQWANTYVDPTKRARFSSIKEIISLVSGVIFTALVGFAIDKFEEYNNLSGGFLFISAAIFILNVCNFISLACIKKDKPSADNSKNNSSLMLVLRETVGNKNFKSVIILTILWDVARYSSVGFLGVFKNKDLMMSVFLVQLINMIANITRVFISKPLGRYSDKNSFSKGFELGLWMAATAFFVNMFTTKTTWFFIIIYTILYNCSYAGTNQNSFNIVYSYVNSKYIVQAMAIKNCIGGLFGFAASILGGKILDAVQTNNNMIFGIHIYGQQILSAISFVITLIAIIFIRKVIEKQKILIQ